MSLFSCEQDFFIFSWIELFTYYLQFQTFVCPVDILTTCQKVPVGFSADGCGDGAVCTHDLPSFQSFSDCVSLQLFICRSYVTITSWMSSDLTFPITDIKDKYHPKTPSSQMDTDKLLIGII